MNDISVRIKGGRIIANAVPDDNYPGIDVEFVPDGYNGEVTNPRILFEYVHEADILRVLIWDDPDDEDYTREIEFSI